MAKRIPPELFERIIWHLNAEYNKLMEPLEMVSPWDKESSNMKQHLGLCSLTCKYWANNIRPYMFARLALRSRSDALFFIELLKATYSHTTNIRFHLTRLHLQMTLPLSEAPWIHLVLLHICRLQERDRVHIFLDITGASTADLSPRSILQGLPRPLPPTCMWRIDTLTLENLRFTRFEDLLPFVACLRSNYIALKSVSWAPSAPGVTPVLPWTSPSAARDKIWFNKARRAVHMDGCTSIAPLLCFFTTTLPMVVAHPDSAAVHIGARMLLRLTSLLKLIAEDFISSRPDGSPSVEAHIENNYFDVHHGHSKVRTISIIVDHQPDEKRAFTLTIGRTGLLDSIDLCLLDDDDTRVYRKPGSFKCAWDALDRDAAQFLPTLSRVRITLRRNSLTSTIGHMHAFARYVTIRMPLVADASKLEFYCDSFNVGLYSPVTIPLSSVGNDHRENDFGDVVMLLLNKHYGSRWCRHVQHA